MARHLRSLRKPPSRPQDAAEHAALVHVPPGPCAHVWEPCWGLGVAMYGCRRCRTVARKEIRTGEMKLLDRKRVLEIWQSMAWTRWWCTVGFTHHEPYTRWSPNPERQSTPEVRIHGPWWLPPADKSG